MTRLQTLLLPVIIFVNELDKALQDKKLSFFEAIGLIPEAAALAAIWPELGSMKTEYEALTAQEQAELLDYIGVQLAMENEIVEDVVLIALDTASNIYLLTTLIKKARA